MRQYRIGHYERPRWCFVALLSFDRALSIYKIERDAWDMVNHPSF